MNQSDVLKSTAATSWMVLSSYLDDLSDADLMKRPGQGCNHVAWQLGHLISSSCNLLNSLSPGSAPALPSGFAEKHNKDAATSDDASKFCKKAEYVTLFEKVHAAANAAIDKLTAADLDKPAPESFKNMFPRAGDVWVLVATHELMHAGQLVPIRRSLGKPIKI